MTSVKTLGRRLNCLFLYKTKFWGALFLLRKGVNITAFPLFIKNKQGRYLGQYAGHSFALLVVEVYIKYYYWQGSVYDIILLFKIINHSL